MKNEPGDTTIGLSGSVSVVRQLLAAGLLEPHQQPGGVLVVQDPERLRVALGHRRQQLGVGRDPIGTRAHA